MQYSHCDAGARKREEGRMGTQSISREFSSILLVYWKLEVLSEIIALTSSVVSDG